MSDISKTQLPLEGLRVVDLSDGVAGAYATKLLAGWGATVVKVEPPGGDPTRRLGPGALPADPDASILFSYLNTGKKGVVCDPAATTGQKDILRLCRWADLVVESGAPGEWAARAVDFDALRRERPALVVCSVTPFGQDGPCAGWRTTALTAFAPGGQMALCGDDDKPPLKTAGFQAEYQGGLHVFSAALAALVGANRSGRGDHIDISLQEVQAACLENAGPVAMVRETDAARTGNQLRAIWGMYPSADGYIGVNAMARQTAAVYRVIGQPQLSEDPAFMNLLANPEMNPVVEALITEWAGQRTSQQIYEESGRQRAPMSVVASPRELLDSDALRQSNFWQKIDHPRLGRHVTPGLPFDLDGSDGSVTRAPLLGEHTLETLAALPLRAPATGPGEPRPFLEGVRVLDLSQVWAGPYATRLLADMGADVIHIEGPAFPDAVRGVGRGGDPEAHNKSVYFNEYNRNKRGLVLDLHRPEGIAAFKRLVPHADVVLENWSVGVAERLGMGYDDLRALNPGIVFVQMPAFGKTGPEAERVGFGPSIEQMGGLVSLQGYEGGPPHRSGISYGDPNAGILAAGAVALALHRRQRTGEGGHVVLRQRDNLAGMVGEYMVAESLGVEIPPRMGNRDPLFAPQGAYRCKDDEGRIIGDIMGEEIGRVSDNWVAISIDSDASWAAFVDVLGDARLRAPGLETVEGRRANHDAIDEAITDWTRTREASAVAATLQSAGVSAVPVLSPLQVVQDPHLNARDTFPTVEHPVAGTHRTMRPVWRLRDRPFTGAKAAPAFGQHNREVLSELGGYCDAELDRMESEGILATVPQGT